MWRNHRYIEDTSYEEQKKRPINCLNCIFDDCADCDKPWNDEVEEE